MAARFEIYQSGGQFRWRLHGGNEEIVATGEAYESKDGALRGIETLRRLAVSAAVDDRTGEASGHGTVRKVRHD